jgi:hypothetical protein
LDAASSEATSPEEAEPGPVLLGEAGVEEAEASLDTCCELAAAVAWACSSGKRVSSVMTRWATPSSIGISRAAGLSASVSPNKNGLMTRKSATR